MKVAIFASGNGTNFEALAKRFESGEFPGELVLLFCNHPDAPVMERAKRLKIPAESFTVKSCGGKEEYEKKVLALLKEHKIDFIVLAGYLRVVGATILDEYDHRMINLHPAWLPEYPGLHSIERAFEDGKSQTGVTVHYIDADLDAGPIIAQCHVPILPTDTLETLETRVHEVEHQLFPLALRQALTAATEKEHE
ncbi:MAG: phosphoribosylglycinamide formyltransferase [Limosilactobacillus sp.]|uniref:phosphoribosylglycinamide formyltransferase n=1 Tax=Limosilactobacillus sp. TaxID=2773925 RepID=UPI0026FF9CF0|nr:phosphoribosylglycinamide formyltransferase [Limosilactobacillus sp.]